MSKNRLISIVVAALIAWAFGTGQFSGNSGSGDNNQGPVGNSGSAKRSSVGGNEIGFASLPKEAKTVVGLIYNGGPFPYRKDGTTFQNREKRLPGKKRGYYREYTVKTPGAKNRGAKRIVAGGPKSKPDAMYFTTDHYKTFKRIVGANK